MIKRHAECDALKHAERLVNIGAIKNNKFDMVVIRINKTGELCESAPCIYCTKSLAESKIIKINKIYFSQSDRSIASYKFNEWILNGKKHISKGRMKIK
jgi:deoxycytidylate deaminase